MSHFCRVLLWLSVAARYFPHLLLMPQLCRATISNHSYALRLPRKGCRQRYTPGSAPSSRP